jgi:hypothetical protein
LDIRAQNARRAGIGMPPADANPRAIAHGKRSDLR